MGDYCAAAFWHHVERVLPATTGQSSIRHIGAAASLWNLPGSLCEQLWPQTGLSPITSANV